MIDDGDRWWEASMLGKYTCALIVFCILNLSSAAVGADLDICAPLPSAPKELLAVVKASNTTDVPDLIPTTKIIPAGASTELVLQKEFDPQTSYRVVIDGNSIVSLTGAQVSARRIPVDHRFVKAGLVTEKSTTLTLQVPSALASAWSEATIYAFGCKAGQTPPIFVSSLTMPVSYSIYSGAIVWFFVILVYVLIGVASRLVDQEQLRWYRYLDPVVLTAGSNGKGNLAKLQILFFSLIVAGLVGFIVSRTGILSDLSSTILILLGIAGVGSAAAKATDVSRNRLDFENWAWLIRKGWLPEGGLAAVNRARWRDIVTTDGEFDVYHFQNLIFSLVVGGALLVVGLRDLASFSIPETLLGVLGLSQVVYIGGKLVAPPTYTELNTALTSLREAERDFVKTAAETADPAPPAGTNATDAPANLAAAIKRAGQGKYAAYMDRAKNARIMFRAVTGRAVAEANIPPAFAS